MTMTALWQSVAMTHNLDLETSKQYRRYLSIIIHWVDRYTILLSTKPYRSPTLITTCFSPWNAGYDPELGSRDFKTVSAVLEYTHPLTGQIYHLVIHQAIQIPNLDHHLLFPMECRVNDITINEVPKLLMNTTAQDSHSIVAHDVENPLNPLVLPLYIHGVEFFQPQMGQFT